MEWLRHEYAGVRTSVEATEDLLTIGRAGWRSEAHVVVDPDEGEPVEVTGHVAVKVNEAGQVTVEVDGSAVFAYHPRDCAGAWLSTLDGADYYSLRIDVGSACLGLRDAYNGL